MNVNKIIFLFFFSVIFCQTEVVSGFLREVEMSFCMDECGEYYIDTFENTQCKHIMSRGKRKGEQCGNNCQLGYDYCGLHLKSIKK